MINGNRVIILYSGISAQSCHGGGMLMVTSYLPKCTPVCHTCDYLQSLPSRDNSSEESPLLSNGADRDVEESKKGEKTGMKTKNDFQTITVPASGAAVRTFCVCRLMLCLSMYMVLLSTFRSCTSLK